MELENKYITVAYKLYSIEDGEREFTEEAPEAHPFMFISGLGATLEAFENQVKDLKPGEGFDFTIPCEQAYGEYNNDHVFELSKDIFVVNGKFDSEHVVPGAVVPLMTGDGERINGSVVEILDNTVKMDMNHPLAGCDLNFVGKVVENRPATNQELEEMINYISGGSGGCSCGCGDGGCDCGDGGCGCGDHEHDHDCGCGCH